jgi:hypothetical protein
MVTNYLLGVRNRGQTIFSRCWGITTLTLEKIACSLKKPWPSLHANWNDFSSDSSVSKWQQFRLLMCLKILDHYRNLKLAITTTTIGSGNKYFRPVEFAPNQISIATSANVLPPVW